MPDSFTAWFWMGCILAEIAFITGIAISAIRKARKRSKQRHGRPLTTGGSDAHPAMTDNVAHSGGGATSETVVRTFFGAPPPGGTPMTPMGSLVETPPMGFDAVIRERNDEGKPSATYVSGNPGSVLPKELLEHAHKVEKEKVEEFVAGVVSRRKSGTAIPMDVGRAIVLGERREFVTSGGSGFSFPPGGQYAVSISRIG